MSEDRVVPGGLELRRRGSRQSSGTRSRVQIRRWREALLRLRLGQHAVHGVVAARALLDDAHQQRRQRERTIRPARAPVAAFAKAAAAAGRRLARPTRADASAAQRWTAVAMIATPMPTNRAPSHADGKHRVRAATRRPCRRARRRVAAAATPAARCAAGRSSQSATLPPTRMTPTKHFLHHHEPGGAAADEVREEARLRALEYEARGSDPSIGMSSASPRPMRRLRCAAQP